MKKGFLNIVLLISALIMLVGCSSNTQSENTGIGAVTGAIVGGLTGSLFGQGTGQILAIGAGAVAGAYIGGAIGHNMDSIDCQRTYGALNHNSPNQSTSWTNRNTGKTYIVTPTSNRLTVNGNPNCRQYRTTAIINGKRRQVYGTACLQSDGTWRSV